jgi:hypothetical protein
MRKVKSLANVQDPAGRVDVALYRMACAAADRLEKEQGILGLREHVLPLLEQAIAKHIPAKNFLPKEMEVLQAFMKICELNREKKAS